MARKLLVLAIEGADQLSLTEEILGNPVDDRQGAKNILAGGMVISTLMLLASLTFELEVPGFKMAKKETSAEQIKAIAELVSSLRSLLPEAKPELKAPKDTPPQQ